MKKIFVCLMTLFAAITASAQEPAFGQNKVQYRNFDWYYFQTPHFDIYFYKGEDTLATFAAKSLEVAYIEIKEQLNYNLTERVPVILYASHGEFEQTNVISDIIPEGVGGVTEAFKNRMTIPFTGSYEEFRHVLHHELTHAVWFNLLYGNTLRSILSAEALFQPPLWFAEGYAEFSSRHGWDLEADMYARDAITEGYMPPLEFLDGFLAYKGGQSTLEYISEKYGEEKIPEILNKGKYHKTMERAVKSALGVSIQDLSDDWQKDLRRVYWPEIAERKEPKEISRALTDHVKDGSLYNQKPVWSPKGDRLAFFSDRANPRNGYSDRYNDVFIISTVDGKIISHLVKAERSGDLESLHSYVSGLTWSPDGNELAFVGKSHGRDMLLIYNADNGKRKKKIELKLGEMRNPAWSPDGKKIAFEGIDHGLAEIYVYHLDNGKLDKLMNDLYDDTNPTWDEKSRFVAFASDRPFNRTPDSTFKYGDYNIFLCDAEADTISPLIESPYKDDQPAFSPDGKRIAFVSNRNGIDNIYIYEIDSKKTIPVTNLISGAFSPTWSPEGDQIAYSGFFKLGFDIYILKNLKNVGDEKDELTLTAFMKKLRCGDKNIFVPKAIATADTAIVKPDTTKKANLDFTTYVFRAGESEIVSKQAESPVDTTAHEVISEDSLRAALDTLKYQKADGSFIEHRYKLKFAPELVSGGFTYDNFYGLRGQSFLSISDMFGNHHFFLYTDLVNTIDQSNFQLAYSYTAHRPNLAFGVFHFKNLYYNDSKNYYFSDRVYGVQGYVSYPFSKFTRLDFTLSQTTIARDNFDYNGNANSTSNILNGNLEYINDSVIWGLVGPVSGHRYKVALEQSIKAVRSDLSYYAIEADYRNYWHFWSRYNFAFRMGAAASGGPDAKKYYMGGTANWIGPKRSQGDVFNVKDIYLNELVVPLRGYRYFTNSGTRYWITNFEFRYPFIDYFKMQFPLPMTLAQISGALFWDMGMAWGGDPTGNKSDFSHAHLRDPVKDTVPRPGEMLGGIGFGPRANLGIFVLRVDIAWATNLKRFSPRPQWYFSFGAEF